MKKIAVISILLLVFSAFSIAEPMDFSVMTDDQLIAMRDLIDQELASRSGETEESPYSPWYDTGLGNLLPKIEDVVGHDVTYVSYQNYNSSSGFVGSIEWDSQEDFIAYVDAVKSWGFNENMEYYGYAYSAVKDSKYKVTIYYFEQMSQLAVTIDIIS